RSSDLNFINPHKSNVSFKYIEPKYISTGYKEVERIEEENYLSILYKDKLDNYIIYQMMLYSRDVIVLDTEDAFVENIKFNNQYAQYEIGRAH
ncbi:DUF4367 domain-containing protein, partial [Clostridioides difficile]|uniref:DUF4367 domain-containing protein n=1 Tax=Clostridioides difficile TaxID=1496 RepID=UPI001CA597D9